MNSEITTSDSIDQTSERFRNADEVPLHTWLNFESEEFGEYLHIVPKPDDYEVLLYRNVGETGGDRILMTRIENARFTSKVCRDDRLSHLYLTYGEAYTLMTALSAYLREAEPGESAVTFTYYEENGKPMHEGRRTQEESLWFKYRAPHVERQTLISSTYQTDIHMMGRFEGGLR